MELTVDHGSFHVAETETDYTHAAAASLAPGESIGWECYTTTSEPDSTVPCYVKAIMYREESIAGYAVIRISTEEGYNGSYIAEVLKSVTLDGTGAITREWVDSAMDAVVSADNK